MERTEALSPEEIENLKSQHGSRIYELKVAADEDGNTYAYAYLRRPARPVLSAVMNRIQSDPLGSIEMLLRNCIITEVSDTRILDDDDMFIAAAQSANELINVRQSELKKT